MITISEALPNELNVVRYLAGEIWPRCYDRIISGGQIKYMLDLLYSDEKLNHDLESGQKFLLVKDHADYIGFAAIEHHWKGSALTRIHKIYLLPEYQGKGIGKALMNEISARSRKMNDTGLSLNVNRQNPAQHFYTRLGFEIKKSEDIDIGQGYLMEDYVMECPLVDNNSGLNQ